MRGHRSDLQPPYKFIYDRAYGDWLFICYHCDGGYGGFLTQTIARNGARIHARVNHP